MSLKTFGSLRLFFFFATIVCVSTLFSGAFVSKLASRAFVLCVFERERERERVEGLWKKERVPNFKWYFKFSWDFDFMEKAV